MKIDFAEASCIAYLSALIVYGGVVLAMRLRYVAKLINLISAYAPDALKEIHLGELWWLKSPTRYPLAKLMIFARGERMNEIPEAVFVKKKIITINRMFLIWVILAVIFVFISVAAQVFDF